MQNLQIPTTDEIRSAVRAELSDFFSNFHLQPQPEAEEIGRGAEFASRITGKAVPTIYSLCHERKIPHSKQGKDLYFSKTELLKWLRDGKRKTQSELALEAENFSTEKSKQTKIGVAI